MVLVIEISKSGNILAAENTSCSSNRQNAGNADKMGISGIALCLLALKIALIIHDNRKYAKRAFYCIRNTEFGVGIMIPAFLIQSSLISPRNV